MRLGNRVFKPGIIPTIVFLLILPVLLRLGFWQLDRAEEKRQMIQLFQQQEKAGPLKLSGYLELQEVLNYRKANITGNYVSEKQVFVDNKIYQGNTGVYVVTPFKIKNSEYSILVNRGWVSMAKDRKQLPIIKTPGDVIELNGKLKIIEESPFRLGKQFQSNEGWPALVQWLNVQDIKKKSGLKLLPYVLLLNESEESGFKRDWKPVVMQPEKSTSYAVQWFSLAFALVVIYIVVNLKREKENE